MKRPVGLTVVAILALAQGVLGALRAAKLIEVGSDLLGRGLVLVPIIGTVAIARGILVAGIGFLYVLFAWGAFTRRGWARGVGFAAAVLNGLVVLSFVVQEGFGVSALLWIIVPVVLVCYLLAPAGRRALAG